MKKCFPLLIVAALSSTLHVAETRAQAPVSNQTFNITLAGAPVSVERWGTGPTAIIFFGYWPFDIQENLKADFGSEFAALVGSKYSMFLWTYPEQVAPYSQAIDALSHYYDWLYGGIPDDEDPFAKRPNFAGQATSVVNQIRAATGLTDVCLIGNSFGAGVILWDLENLAKNPSTRFVLISPTEVFMPPVPPMANPLPRTVLVADAKLDELVLTEAAADYLIDRTTGPLPPGYEPFVDNPHFIIGGLPLPLDFVFSLVNSTPSIISKTSVSGAVDKAFSYRIMANNSPSRYGATALPAGLSLDSQKGVISGKPRRAGTFRVQISATNGSGMGNASLSIVVAKGTQTILFSPPKTKRFRKGGTFTLSATATSGLPTTFTSSKPKILSIKGNKATIGRKGPVTVTAHQKGTANYRPAKVSKTIVIK